MLKARNHWFNTYYCHYLKKLHIDESTYDPCLLYTNSNSFGVVGLQTNNTLFLTNNMFATTKKSMLKKAGFLAKERKKLTLTMLIRFNKGQIKLDNGLLLLT